MISIYLASEPPILDVPFEGRDPFALRRMLDSLSCPVAERGMTPINLTHDVNLMPEMADVSSCSRAPA
jgi:energy-coupling factor transporter ATP-binding protein EcfA2